MSQKLRAIGLMSGTSMDGVDVALIETDGESFVSQGPSGFLPYDGSDRALLRSALQDAVIHHLLVITFDLHARHVG